MEAEELYAKIIPKLRGLRAERNLTLEEVANKVGIGRDTLSLYENGKRKLSLVSLLKLLQLYDIDISIFFKTILDNSRGIKKDIQLTSQHE